MCIRDRLKRDAQIAYWQAVAQGGDAQILAAQRDATLHTLDAEFAFVAECNVGSEFMSDDKCLRMQQIGARPWQRTLDDRLGLSRDELARRSSAPLPLPAQETLLADKAEHRICLLYTSRCV